MLKHINPHLFVLGLVKEAPFNMGRRLLASCLIGKETERIKRLGLHKLVNFGTLPLYDKTDIYELIDSLVYKKCLKLAQVGPNKFMKVISITQKGLDELNSPSEEFSIKKGLKKSHYSNILKITEKDRIIFEKLGPILEGLSDEQKKAVICDSKSILCVAGAGSGKTRALTRRAWFLANFKSAKNILAITFTRKAKNEMRERIGQLSLKRGSISNNIEIETFNSFCEKILRKKEPLIYNKKHKVMSFGMQIKVVSWILDELGISPEHLLNMYYSKKKLYSKDSKTLFFGFINDVFSLLDYQRNNYISDIGLLNLVSSHYDTALSNIIKKILVKIKEYKKKYGLRDFTDQLTHVIKFFKKSPNNIPKFEHLLIDEFQDINSLQFELISLLNPDNLFAVGDPRQSIYGWRGSKIDFILDFEKIYKGASILELSTNYRSEKKIVECCNHVIKSMGLPDIKPNPKQSELADVSESSEISELSEISGNALFKKNKESKSNNSPVVLIRHSSEDSELVFVVESILSINAKRKDIFVLARTNRQVDAISELMARAGIKHVKRTVEERNKREADEDEVTVSTIHAIKGLEAEIVYIIGANAKNMPCKASEHPLLETVKANDTYDKYEEERRLLYVAMSRAKSRLIINYSGKISPFIDDALINKIRKNRFRRPAPNESLLYNSDNKYLAAEGLNVQVNSGINSVGHYKASPNLAVPRSKLYDELKDYRYIKSKELNIPAYHIFSNKTLMELVEAMPTSFEDLESITGFGPYKIRRYGNDIIRIIINNA